MTAKLRRVEKPSWATETYREFHIFPSSVSYMRSTDWSYSHDDYDGADDSNDNRCGHGASIEECKREIDLYWEDIELT